MAVTLTNMARSPLWRDLAEKYGWGEAELTRLAGYGADLKAAILADRRPGGPRQQRVKDALRREFSADERAVRVLAYEDRAWEKEGFRPKDEATERAAKAEYVALLMTD